MICLKIGNDYYNLDHLRSLSIDPNGKHATLQFGERGHIHTEDPEVIRNISQAVLSLVFEPTPTPSPSMKKKPAAS